VFKPVQIYPFMLYRRKQTASCQPLVQYRCVQDLSIGCWPTLKQICGYSITAILWDPAKIQSMLDPERWKKLSFWLQYYKDLSCMCLRKNSVSFRLQYYYDAWDLEKDINLNRPSPKKNIFVYDCPTAVVQSAVDPTEKKIASSFGTWKKFHRSSTATDFYSYSTIMVHGT